MMTPRKTQLRLALLFCWGFGAAAEAQMLNVSDAPVAQCQQPSLQDALDSTENPHARLSWIPNALLSESQRGECYNGLCSGFYYNPPLPAVPGLPSDAIHVLADSSRLTNDGRTEMLGSVRIRDGERLLEADRALLNSERTQLTLEGNIRVQEPEVLFLGDRAILDTVKTTADLQGVEYVVFSSGIHGNTDRLQRFDSGLTRMTNTQFSSCEPGSQVWQMSADEFSIDQASGWGEARGATVRVADIPVIYVPYLRFPVDKRRMSGFLWPTIGLSDRNGLELAVPYYFNLAPHYDLTLTPRYMSERGPMLEGQFRYLTDIGIWDVSAAYLPGDNAFARSNPEQNDNRWFAQLRHEGGFGENWSSAIDFTRVSDIDYLRDINTSSIQVKRNAHLQQRGEIRYSDANWLISTQMRGYQVLREGLVEPYRMLPRINISHLASRPNRINTLFTADIVGFDHDEKVRGARIYQEYGFNLPLASAGGFITPTVKYKQLSQRLRGTEQQDLLSVDAPSVSLDAGLFFDRQLTWGDKQLNQSFEPRMFYLYTPFRDQSEFASFDATAMTFNYQQLFRERRSTSYDRLEDARQLSLGFTSRINDEATGRELLRLSFGQIYHFQPPRVLANQQIFVDTTSRSDYAASFDYMVGPHWRHSVNMVVDSADQQISNAQWRSHYSAGETIYNLGYSVRRDVPQRIDGDVLNRRIEQVDLSAMAPIDERWKLMGRWQYDLVNKRSADKMVGFEYDSCCWKTQLLLRDYTEQLFDGSLRKDTGVFVYFELKGLGGSGGSLQNVLGENIYGFRPIEQEQRLSGW